MRERERGRGVRERDVRVVCEMILCTHMLEWYFCNLMCSSYYIIGYVHWLKDTKKGTHAGMITYSSCIYAPTFDIIL